MPAALFSSEMERSSSAALEDQRALQLALELSMLGLQPAGSGNGGDQTNPADLVYPTGATPDQLDSTARQPLATGTGPKKSQNTTECVPVPSSEHVAEIVGRQGAILVGARMRSEENGGGCRTAKPDASQRLWKNCVFWA
ncbi:RNA-binding protein MEX3B-like [Tropilaelaps mercedesae]|uniref:RNA-binding protein MEX3B-like n=1 Tax=Tropilaelaps mercedesae TaxID=418985 RepID=A0A1V9XYB7_9ACAR|nr:RNA-binding protein MEX3B-like [Tropilaelaps mercedesae]